MKDKSTNPTSIADNLLWIGIGLAAVFWIAESAIHVFIFHEGELTPECPLVRILSGEERVEYDAERVRNDGVTVPCIVTATPFVEPGGELVGIVENFKDITERKQPEEALQKAHDNLEQRVRERPAELVSANEQLKREIEERERAEKARRESEERLYQKHKRIEMFEFTNALSLKLMDELRNPLVAVGGFAARISSGDYPEDKLREYTGVIFKESKRLDNVLEEVVTHLKATAEQV